MSNFKISKRLLMIADMVPYGSRVIDVGADHGLLDIYLNKYKGCVCLATDISSLCVENALKNIEKYGANVETKVTDGLSGIELSDEIIIISGMGTNNIKKILDTDINNDLIISSHTDILDLKNFLETKNYKVVKESFLEEKRMYHVIYFKSIV